MPQPKIDLIYIDAGGGHRAAVTALDAVIREQQRPWETRARNIQDLLYSIDFIRKLTGIPFQEVYNIMLRRGWTLGTAQLIPPMHLAIRIFHDAQVRALAGHWSQDPPHLVVSLIPHYNRAIKQALAQVCPAAALVTILTDIADYPPHFWIERQDQYVICGSSRAVAQARALGYLESRILRTSGMILNPNFYAARPLDRAAERTRLGLRPDLPTALVSFGGEGSMDALKVARAINRSRSDVQMIVLCGRHQEVSRKLRAMCHRVPVHVEGFTTEVPFYMRLADFFVGKPGPGSISEALAMRLPVIVERSPWTLAHERYNADWIVEQQVGMVVSNFSHIGEAVAELLSPPRYERYRANAAALKNAAVYEIPDLLAKVLEGHGRIEARAHYPGYRASPSSGQNEHSDSARA
ncbi:MAG TPA: glycosyltransferase [Bryobacteraceae bacterium]|nr:glycosyltransferase [Bryobacteraceae bacterium]